MNDCWFSSKHTRTEKILLFFTVFLRPLLEEFVERVHLVEAQARELLLEVFVQEFFLLLERRVLLLHQSQELQPLLQVILTKI